MMALCALAVGLYGIGYAAWWAVVARPLPWPEDTRWMDLRIDLRDIDFQVGLSDRLVADVRAHGDVFDAVVVSASHTPRQADATGRSWRLAEVSTDFLAPLGVVPAIGRSLQVADSDLPPLLLSDALWRSRWQADPGVLGQPLRLGAVEYRVVGVLPAGFAWPDASTEAWTPWRPSAEIQAQDAEGAFGYLDVAARLAPGVTLAQAHHRLESVLAASGKPMLQRGPDWVRAQVRPWRERLAGERLHSVWLLQAGGALAVLVALANLIQLIRAQGLAGAAALRMRQVLGAPPAALYRVLWRRVRLPLGIGVAVGVGLVPLGLQVLQTQQLVPDALPWPAVHEWPMWAGAALAAGVLVLCVAVLLGSGARHWPRQAMAAPRAARWMSFGALQVGLCTLLGGVALLLASGMWARLQAPKGFDPDQVLLVQVDEDSPLTLGERIEAVRGVLPAGSALAHASMPPFSGAEFVGRVRLPGGTEIEVGIPEVGPGYFQTLRMPLRAGQDFTPAPSVAATQVVVDQAFLARWPVGSDPIGRSLQWLDENGAAQQSATIVGVVDSVRQKALDEAPGLPQVYRWMDPAARSGSLLVRTPLPANIAMEALRGALARTPQGVRMETLEPLVARIDRSLQGVTLLLQIVAVLALGSVLMAAAGLTAGMRLLLQARQRELAIRAAVGGRPIHLLRAEVGRGVRWLLPGAVAGVLAGLWVGPRLSLPLYQVTGSDPMIWGVAALGVLGLALLAIILPLRRLWRPAPVLEVLREPR